MTLFLIGTGLEDMQDISLKGLACLNKSHKIYIEC